MGRTTTITRILYVFGVLGILGTWGRTVVDGTLIHLFNALHGAPEYVLPGTKELLRRSFTGIYWPVDYLLDVLVIFFWEAVDGSHPTTSVIGIYFLGQLLPIIVGFYQDSFRAGQGSTTNMLRPTLWLLSFQMAALAGTGWIWALVYTASSPLTSTSLSRNALQSASLIPPQVAQLILPSVVLGYVVPAVLMALPSPGITTNNFQQIALVAWNLYPLLVFMIFHALGAIGRVSFNKEVTHSATSAREHLRVVRWVNAISLAFSIIIHIGVSALSISTVLFPTLFNAKYTQALHPSSLFIPPVSFSHGNTVGDGVRSFMMWDQVFGYAVVLLVMLMQLRTAIIVGGKSFGWVNSVATTLSLSVIGGPGSAFLAISWFRDETLLGYDTAGARHKR